MLVVSVSTIVKHVMRECDCRVGIGRDLSLSNESELTPRPHTRWVLQFISSIMVSFSFLSYVELTCSLVCILTIEYILWFFWVLWTPLLSNSDLRCSPSATTGRDYTYWLILLTLISDSLVFCPILSYRTRISYYSSIPSCSMEFYAYASPSISR